ncbi:STAS domain-containing protein [uncultured Mycolicibacterium sp.]|uniref:STAS domain-containing protein n=1 Tax=uncultured Mycolicibacterium sp. TaxID=2320817 RepID=UPI0026379DD0|nr:STAS domain-containing protein [uncultured Mycolicibacterium sp.]
MSPSTTPPGHGDVVRCRTARFRTHWVPPATAVVTVDGELDAANCSAFRDYAVAHGDGADRLILDLSDVGFAGTVALSALHAVGGRCADRHIPWAVVAGPTVDRLLRLCEPGTDLPVRDSVAAALRDRPLLQLVAQPR